MEVIPEPANSASVLVLSQPNYISPDSFAVIRGSSDTDYVCGACGVVLGAKVSRGQLVNLVFKCLNCSSYNVVRGT
jgi:hypothetical protein